MTGNGFFITGTNTDVGKTVFTRAFARLIRNRGLDVAAIKPVESGVHASRESDASTLIDAAVRQDTIEAVSPYRFKAPISPHLAAEKENAHIDPGELIAFMNGWLDKADVVLAEGAGGLLVPLGDRFTYADVVAKTSYKLIIVAPNILGTINATLLTIEAARARKIPIAGVILNRTPSADFGNKNAISRFGHIPIIKEIPDLPMEIDRMAEAIAEHIDVAILNTPAN